MSNRVKAVTALDGRYASKIEDFTNILSEFGLFKYRVFVECQWLVFLNEKLNLFALDEKGKEVINGITTNFSEENAIRIKEIESTTNHDVKAVEYFIKEALEANGLADIKEWVHFACTSEDINNTAYALMIKNARVVLQNSTEEVLTVIETMAKSYKDVPMMSRTHGQPASPTTVGKELVNYAWRIKREMDGIEASVIEGKMNGATGNFNAHYFAFPNIDWINKSEIFISEYLGLEPLKFTTQINPYSYISQILHGYIRLSSILIDFDRDMWTYISINYFTQKLKEGEVGSSTMPHKVNPIDFENSEGNLGIAISMMEHMAVKLLNSRMQRDLTDSTVLRNFGSVFGYVLLGIKSTIKGLGKLELNAVKIEEDLTNNIELLAEAIQTVMRVYNEENPYEKLKALTRGEKITQDALNSFIDGLEQVPGDVKDRMKQLTPHNYVGLAPELVEEYFGK